MRSFLILCVFLFKLTLQAQQDKKNIEPCEFLTIKSGVNRYQISTDGNLYKYLTYLYGQGHGLYNPTVYASSSTGYSPYLGFGYSKYNGKHFCLYLGISFSQAKVPVIYRSKTTNVNTNELKIEEAKGHFIHNLVKAELKLNLVLKRFKMFFSPLNPSLLFYGYKTDTYETQNYVSTYNSSNQLISTTFVSSHNNAFYVDTKFYDRFKLINPVAAGFEYAFPVNKKDQLSIGTKYSIALFAHAQEFQIYLAYSISH